MRISVIVPVYRVEKYIHRCVASILGQTFSDLELILVDDGSPDTCGSVCDAYEKMDPRVIALHRENGGLSAARNTGIEWMLAHSDSEYVTFVDSDDWLHPQYLELLLQGLKYGAISMVDKAFVTGSVSEYSVYTAVTPRTVDAETLMCENVNYNYAWGKLFPRAAFATLRFPEGKNFEDVFTTYQALFAAQRIGLVELPLYYYFYNPEGISHGPWQKTELAVLEGMEQQMAFYRTHSYSKALRREETLYINHYAYLLNRIRQNRPCWRQNRPIWHALRRKMKQKMKLLGFTYQTMPQCRVAAHPHAEWVKKQLGRLRRVCRRLVCKK